jgi:hypothetical protein
MCGLSLDAHRTHFMGADHLGSRFRRVRDLSFAHPPLKSFDPFHGPHDEHP